MFARKFFPCQVMADDLLLEGKYPQSILAVGVVGTDKGSTGLCGTGETDLRPNFKGQIVTTR
jgi:hypothetical protein